MLTIARKLGIDMIERPLFEQCNAFSDSYLDKVDIKKIKINWVRESDIRDWFGISSRCKFKLRRLFASCIARDFHGGQLTKVLLNRLNQLALDLPAFQRDLFFALDEIKMLSRFVRRLLD